MYKRILVPFDGSETSRQALAAAVQLAREAGGRLRIIHALDDLAYLNGYALGETALDAARARAMAMLADAMASAGSAGVPAESTLLEVSGRRLGEIVADEARAFAADLVAVGTHGRRGIGRLLLGSGAEQVIRMAPVAVLVVRASDRPAKP